MALSVRTLLKQIRWKDATGYLLSLAALVLATLIGLVVQSFVEGVDIGLIYLVAVVLSATTWGLGPSAVTSFLAAILIDALFDPPYGLFSPSNGKDLLTLSVFLLIAVAISRLGSRTRAQMKQARQREAQTAALYHLSRDMAAATDRVEILSAAIKQISVVFDAEAIVFVPNGGNVLQPIAGMIVDEREQRAIEQTFESGKPLDHGMTNLSQFSSSYVPLQTAQGTFGVLGLRRRNEAELSSSEERRLLETFATQIAVALEHAKLSEQAEQGRVLEENDRFRNVLLASLSHDLLTPITSIMGSVTTLMDNQVELDTETRYELLENAREDAARLRGLVGNMLDMTRVEASILKPQWDWHSIEEVVEAAVARSEDGKHVIQAVVERDLSFVQFDFVLIEQVLINLLDNAIKFSPPDSLIQVCANGMGDSVQVSVTDCGIGVPPTELNNIFEKFYRLRQSGSPPGMGLGLAICKGIVEAHSGKIWAETRQGGGTRVVFVLPTHQQEAA